MQYLFVFLEGIATFISPCLLPMLPIYLSYFAASGEGDKSRVPVRNILGFILGFTVVFALLGVFAGSVGRLLVEYKSVINMVTGGVVVLLGAHFLGLFRIHLPFRRSGGGVPARMGFWSAALFGVVFSVSWTPCVGAFLGSALMLAAQKGSALEGVLMLTLYALGLGIPFFFSALFIDRLKGTFNFVKRNYRIINGISGGLLIIMGLLMMTGYLDMLLSLAGG